MPRKGEKMTAADRANWMAKMAVIQATPEHKAKLSAAHKGLPHYKTVGVAISAAKKGKPNGLLGRKWTPEARRNASAAAKARVNHNFRTDGKGRERNTKRKAEMNGVEYRLWREAVFVRDDFTCQECGQRGSVYLVADHVKPWRTHPELRYELANGRTLCEPCHRATPTYGSKLVAMMRASA
jgi:5-methylcytosine-specific restriction endonuclease McrA